MAAQLQRPALAPRSRGPGKRPACMAAEKKEAKQVAKKQAAAEAAEALAVTIAAEPVACAARRRHAVALTKEALVAARTRREEMREAALRVFDRHARSPGLSPSGASGCDRGCAW